MCIGSCGWERGKGNLKTWVRTYYVVRAEEEMEEKKKGRMENWWRAYFEFASTVLRLVGRETDIF